MDSDVNAYRERVERLVFEDPELNLGVLCAALAAAVIAGAPPTATVAVDDERFVCEWRIAEDIAA